MFFRLASRSQGLAWTHCSRLFPVSTSTDATTWCIVHGHHSRGFSSISGVTVVSSPSRPTSSTIIPSGVSSWFRFVSLKEMEKSEIDHLEAFIDLTKHLTNHMTDQSNNHPMIEIAHSIRNRDYLRERGTDSTAPNVDDLCKALDNYMAFIRTQEEPYKLQITKAPIQDSETICKYGTSVRLRLLLHYMHHVKLALQEGNMEPNVMNKDAFDRMIDAILLGSASERIQEHIHMFSHSYTQAQLQDCLYTLYNGEISCVHEWFSIQERFKTNEIKRFMWLNSQAKRTKTELKRFNTYAKSYLLDTLELNVKSRCIYNWSDPLHTGMKPLPDEYVISWDELVAARAKYFPEGGSVGTAMMKGYTGERRLFYSDKREFRQNLQYGAVFVVATCLLDWLVCIL